MTNSRQLPDSPAAGSPGPRGPRATTTAQLALAVPRPVDPLLDQLGSFDVILVNSSAGKDSMASLDVIATEAARQGVLDRVVVGHAALRRAEWEGTEELARRQAERYELAFFVTASCRGSGQERVGL